MFVLPNKRALQRATSPETAEMFADVADVADDHDDDYEPIRVTDHYDEQGRIDDDYVPVWGMRIDL